MKRQANALYNAEKRTQEARGKLIDALTERFYSMAPQKAKKAISEALNKAHNVDLQNIASGDVMIVLLQNGICYHQYLRLANCDRDWRGDNDYRILAERMFIGCFIGDHRVYLCHIKWVQQYRPVRQQVHRVYSSKTVEYGKPA